MCAKDGTLNSPWMSSGDTLAPSHRNMLSPLASRKAPPSDRRSSEQRMAAGTASLFRSRLCCGAKDTRAVELKSSYWKAQYILVVPFQVRGVRNWSEKCTADSQLAAAGGRRRAVCRPPPWPWPAGGGKLSHLLGFQACQPAQSSSTGSSCTRAAPSLCLAGSAEKTTHFIRMQEKLFALSAVVAVLAAVISL